MLIPNTVNNNPDKRLADMEGYSLCAKKKKKKGSDLKAPDEITDLRMGGDILGYFLIILSALFSH